jgi:hypothetical protein
MHDRLAMELQEDLTQAISRTSACGVLIDVSSLSMVDSFIGRMLANISAMARVQINRLANRSPRHQTLNHRPDGSPVGGLNMSLALNNIAIGDEHDVVLARQRARQIAGLLGFPDLDQVRIATAVSGTAPASAWRWCGKWSNGWAGAWRMRRTMSS